ncbi:MAG: hypothetical protein DCF30_00070 [Hyphomicrobiales bacterium]|nr:MAG: hypothetical protein DCF30_00070 [Hyphomicrobiales bacterium]
MTIIQGIFAISIAALAGAPLAAQAKPVAPAVSRVDPAATAPVVPVRSILRDLFRSLGEDDYVHDDHYDWDAYRNATSRKDRIRDYNRMQLDMQKDAWRQQKDAQKAMIKAQRGW